MATQTLSNISNYLKKFYIGPIREQLNNSSVLYFRLNKNDEDVSGQDLTANIPLFYGRNQGVGWRSEGGTLPTHGRRLHSNSTIAMAYLYGQVKVSGQAIRGSRDSSHAFAKVIDNEVRGMVEGLKIEMNRACWGDGSGALAQVTQATGSQTAENFFTVDDASRLEAGMVIDMWTAKSGGSQNIDSKTISQVDRRNNKISLTTTETITLSDYIFREDSRGLYAMGLEGIVDGADSQGNRIVSALQGITRSSNIWWDANVIDNNGTNEDMTLDKIQQAYELGEIIGQGRTSLIMSPYALRRAYVDLMIIDRRYVKDLKLDGGFSAVEYSGGGEPVPWVVDYMAPANTLWFLDEKTLAFYRASDMDWMDLDGAVLRKVDSKDEYEATAYAYMNLGCSACNKNTVRRDLQ